MCSSDSCFGGLWQYELWTALSTGVCVGEDGGGSSSPSFPHDGGPAEDIEGIFFSAELFWDSEWSDRCKMLPVFFCAAILGVGVPLGCFSFLILIWTYSRDTFISGQLFNHYFCGRMKSDLPIYHLADTILLYVLSIIDSVVLKSPDTIVELFLPSTLEGFALHIFQ